MFRKVCYSMFILFSITIVFSIVGCNDLHDRLKGEWEVVPQQTVNLEQNKNIVAKNKKSIKNNLNKENYKFIFEDSEMTFRKKSKIVRKSNYEVGFRSDPKMSINADGESIAITFKGDNTATIDGLNATLDIFFVRKQ